ncbi:helix-turn-helix family protein [Orientia chuto str. Dubai]|uniref:Helix-turn-helix family protein n=1 Tax=Orientia chuto str. Dubai TaxID=1359168 RepID=A0A0F3MLU6_9RICK|nr:helix-turn-helix transcriptional regulator [Candidatus Orientia mediorientalis]KJV56743.1 helix-turn-helix family protein [Orientia chuto str. Dubai]
MGNVGRQISKFLKNQMKHMTRMEMAQGSGVSYTEVCALIASAKPNPRLETVAKLSNFFEKSIDEILNRKRKCTNTGISNGYINPELVNQNVRQFLQQFVQDKRLRPSELSTSAGHSIMAVADFISNKKESLGCSILLHIADAHGLSIHGIMSGAFLKTKDKSTAINQEAEQKAVLHTMASNINTTDKQEDIDQGIAQTTQSLSLIGQTIGKHIGTEDSSSSPQTAVSRIIEKRKQASEEKEGQSSSVVSQVMSRRIKEQKSKKRDF